MFNRKSKTISVTIEYRAPHWMVLIRNPGQRTWEPVRSSTKKVRVQDEFGIEVKSYPAIEAFLTMDQAEAWIKANVTPAKFERKARSKSEMKSWFPTEGSVQGDYQYTATQQ